MSGPHLATKLPLRLGIPWPRRITQASINTDGVVVENPTEPDPTTNRADGSYAPDAALVAATSHPVRQHGEEPTYVLVHGLGVSSWYFTALVADLGRYAPIVALDLPGFGIAKCPPRPLRIAGLARSVIESVRALGLDDVVLVGHSMGAQVVIEALALDPAIARAGALLAPVVPPSLRTVGKIATRFANAALHEPLTSWYRSVLTYLTTNPGWIMQHYLAMRDYAAEQRIAAIDPAVDLLLLAGSHDSLSTASFLGLLQRSTQHWRSGGQVVQHIVPGAAHHVMASHTHTVTTALRQLGPGLGKR